MDLDSQTNNKNLAGRGWVGREFPLSYCYDLPFGGGHVGLQLFLFLTPVRLRDIDGLSDRSPGTCILFEHGDPQFFEALKDSENGVVCDLVLLDMELEDLVREMSLPLNTAMELDMWHELRNLIAEIHQEKGRTSMYAPIASRAYQRLLLVKLVRALRNSQPGSGEYYPQELREQMRELCARIHRDPAYPWSVQDLAAQMGQSRSRFWIYFKGIVGMAPQDFIIEARLSKAKMLLTNSNHMVKEIADLCGFSNAYYFSRIFHQRIGCPPSQYADQFKFQG